MTKCPLKRIAAICYLTSALLFLLGVNVQAQATDSRNFFRKYGVNGNTDYGTWAIPTNDLGYLLSLNSPVGQNVGAGIIKTDCQGEIEWQHLYTANGTTLLAHQVIEKANRYYLYGAVGNTLQNAQQFVAQFALDGTLISSQFIRSSTSDLPVRLLAASDNSWWLISTGDNNINYEVICITHLDANFNLLSSKRISLNQKELVVTSASITNGNELVLCGDFSNTAFRSAFVMRVGVNGELRWMKTVNSTYDVFLTDIVADLAGNSYSCGHYYTADKGWDAFLIKMDAFGNVSKHVSMSMTDDDRCRSIAIHDNDLLVVGDCGTFDDREIYWQHFTTAQLGSQLPVLLQTNSLYTNYPYSVAPIHGSGWLITGDYANPSGIRDAALVRLDEYEQLACNTGFNTSTIRQGSFLFSTGFPSIQNNTATVSAGQLDPFNLGFSTSSFCGNYAPIPNFSYESEVICPSVCVSFEDKSECNPQSWYWEFEDAEPATSTEKDPKVCFHSAGEKQVDLTVSNSEGSQKSTFSISFDMHCPMEVPNAFSPDGDGLNDVFVILGMSKNSHLTIFDRWGVIVYTSDNYENNWNGSLYKGNEDLKKPLPSGVYYYLIENSSGDVQKGFVQLFAKAEN